MRVDLGEFRGAYLSEVEEHLAGTRARFAEWERASVAGRSAPRVTRELMRLLHTIKGLSAMVGVEPVVAVAHPMESAVRALEQSQRIASEADLSVLIDALGVIERAVAAVAAAAPIPAVPAELLRKLESVVRLASGAAVEASAAATDNTWLLDGLDAAEREQLEDALAAGRRVVRIRFAPSSARAAAGVNVTTVRERLARLGDIVKVSPVAEKPSPRTPSGLAFSILFATVATDEDLADPAAGLEIEEVVPGRTDLPVPVPVPLDSEPDLSAEGTGATTAGSLRVELERVDEALERFSALVVNRARMDSAIRTLREAGIDTRDLVAVHTENARQMRDLRGAILRLRMVPIHSVLGSLPFMMRGLARTTGKRVELVVENGNTELDKTVAEKLVPALVHLMRNAVDHGIEKPETRRAAGKSEQALVTIHCEAQGGRTVEIRVSDDGHGVDREGITARAGLRGPLDDSALLEVMCRPGFSTRGAADAVSGRGMGMDIVHKAIVEELRGELLMESRPGAGTTFTLRVPLTIAIVDGFTVVCAGHRFVVPVPVVEEIIELNEASLTKTREMPKLLPRRGEHVPVCDLARAVGIDHSDVAARRHALVVRRGHSEILAFAVDRVLQQQETVVRPLDHAMLGMPGVAGATDLGDGVPTIVLDLHGLFGKLREASV